MMPLHLIPSLSTSEMAAGHGLRHPLQTMAASMNRREVQGILGAAAALAALAPLIAHAQAPAIPPGETAIQVGFLIYPDMILLDLVSPLTIFSIMGAKTHFAWKSLEAVQTDVGVPFAPTTNLDNCPRDLDVLFVPGGLKGTVAVMQDPAILEFLADRGSRAGHVTRVCTGSLALAAAGLLNGYKATSHWYVRDLLTLMGASVVNERVVIDRNRVTAGGVTAGMDFAFSLCGLLRGAQFARRLQLVLEYAPKPPFDAGTPDTAGPELTRTILEARAPLLKAARLAAESAGKPR